MQSFSLCRNQFFFSHCARFSFFLCAGCSLFTAQDSVCSLLRIQFVHCSRFSFFLCAGCSFVHCAEFSFFHCAGLNFFCLRRNQNWFSSLHMLDYMYSGLAGMLHSILFAMPPWKSLFVTQLYLSCFVVDSPRDSAQILIIKQSQSTCIEHR